jgi:hypothetical protein
MLPLHLWDAVLAQCTIQALHVFRQWNPESAERQLQLRFPNLTLAHILEHTNCITKPVDLYRSAKIEVHGDYKGRHWKIITYSQPDQYFKLTMQLFSLQHDCSLDILRGDDMCIRANNLDDSIVLILVTVQKRYYIYVWDFQTTIQTYTLPISDIMHRDFVLNYGLDIILAPNRQAICVLRASWFTHTSAVAYIIQRTGFTRMYLAAHATVTWKENQLYADDELIYTIT